ncbi:fumarylacetoacetate hydrolase family protein [Paraburkholderia sp. BL25I1N1]|uniref:fumarylacetoacetate hydrolase family protein n=1 Tax=Paraburkholderia sp. BL25I1N1 TaxID=1938804 RepID=UPI000D07C57C|nr:fumarylacetoacetate hydrolase family protein [Paraburkholderia sp. BL25I1N1]PRX92107.1 2-keto-4-pentenoate hydratase/2-oxohepta-3-ene-1,7-dioic acid hydratase in catechol pathway [Paraburkholderia sp. BL25I1N1]
MKICRFNEDRIGVVLDGEIADVTTILESLGNAHYPYPNHDVFIQNLPRLLPELAALSKTAPRVPLSSVNLLSPVANPGKIIAAPVNYADHLHEAVSQTELNHGNKILTIQMVGLFLKATSSLQGCSHGVLIEHADRRNDHEVELVAIIGKSGRNVPKEKALEYVAGYCIGLDMTVRGTEDRSMRKSVDTFSVAGPWMVTADEIPDPGVLDLRLTVNGEERQRANTRDLVLNTAELIEFATAYYSIEPGDLIFTGTPAGVGPVKAGDVIHAEIASIGAMEVAVHKKRNIV